MGAPSISEHVCYPTIYISIVSQASTHSRVSANAQAKIVIELRLSTQYGIVILVSQVEKCQSPAFVQGSFEESKSLIYY